MKSVPMISAAPRSVIASPRQKPEVSLCFRISQVPSATQRGAVFPSKVALAAVVYESDAVHNPRSHAVNIPASSGNKINHDLIDRFVLRRGAKNGNNKNMEKKIR